MRARHSGRRSCPTGNSLWMRSCDTASLKALRVCQESQDEAASWTDGSEDRRVLAETKLMLPERAGSSNLVDWRCDSLDLAFHGVITHQFQPPSWGATDKAGTAAISQRRYGPCKGPSSYFKLYVDTPDQMTAQDVHAFFCERKIAFWTCCHVKHT